jgi:protein-S-isoprenylcysteine O-methyltransferase Ste14
MSRLLSILYAVVCYAVFLATFLYAIAFVVGVDGVPRHIDNGPAAPLATALAIDVALLLLFAVQHSVMARPGFKRWWTRIVPVPIERSTYVLVSSLVLILLFWEWRPLPQVVWQVEGIARPALYALAGVGWMLVLICTFLISHFELFGLRQVWLHLRGQHSNPDVPFVERTLYRIVRHPMMVGFVIAFWAAPTMTLGHLLFALATTGYIVVAVKFMEERDLVAQYGETYRDYQRRVPMLVPWPRRGA